MKFKVVPKVATKFYFETEPHIWISIQSPGDVPPKFIDNRKRLAILFVEFEDIDIKIGNMKLFDAQIAQEIIDFVFKYNHRITTIYCQCQAGISRSAGTASALALILNGNDDIGRGFLPNRKVYRTILETYHNQKEEYKNGSEGK
jgi:predicted protein tyrosine phosphatase